MSDKPHPAAIEFNGGWHLYNAKGALVPIETIKPVDLLIDELVRATLTEGRALATDMRAFKQRSFERVGALQALLAQEYGATLGGVKGNVTLPGFDGWRWPHPRRDGPCRRWPRSTARAIASASTPMSCWRSPT